MGAGWTVMETLREGAVVSPAPPASPVVGRSKEVGSEEAMSQDALMKLVLNGCWTPFHML